MDASPSAGKISQVLPTTIGTTYTVTFALAGNPSCTSSSPSWVGWITENPVKRLRVTATGSVGYVGGEEFTFDTTSTSASAMGWVTRTMTFTADSATTVLAFESTQPGNCGSAIDAVTISGDPVPTTADQCKKGGWQTLVDSQGNRFKNQGDCVSYVATAGKNLGAIAP